MAQTIDESILCLQKIAKELGRCPHRAFYYFSIPFVPSSELAVDTMLRLAEIKKGDIVYDLGCGDGRIIIEAAKRYGVQGVGIDIKAELIRQCKENSKEQGVENLIEFIRGDFFQADIKEASVVFLYLVPRALDELEDKFIKELRPGSRVISNMFKIGDWEAEKNEPVIYPHFRSLFEAIAKERPGHEIQSIIDDLIESGQLKAPHESVSSSFSPWLCEYVKNMNLGTIYLYRIPPMKKVE